MSCSGAGADWVSVQFEAAPQPDAEPICQMVGSDSGLRHLATLSDGLRIEHPRLARKAAKRMRQLNRVGPAAQAGREP